MQSPHELFRKESIHLYRKKEAAHGAASIFKKLLLLHFSVALAAVYGSVVAGLERNLRFLAASCASGSEELSLSDPKMIATAIAFTIASAALIYYTIKFYSNKKTVEEQL